MSWITAEQKALAQMRGLVSRAGQFFQMEIAGGILLMVAAAAGLLIANSDLYPLYNYVLNDLKFRIGFSDSTGLDMELRKSVLLWINDGLMAIFFFLVGLEIKREFAEGNLSSPDRVILPGLAALGGMVVPAALFLLINRGTPENIDGWAIPMATDIAFALGILLLLGDRVPVTLKVLLTAIAVIDDIGAIVVIALFYTGQIHLEPLYFAAAALAVLFIMNRRNVCSIPPYILTGAILWLAILESGVHATVAGVMTAFFLPMHSRKNPAISPCLDLEHDLHPFVVFAVLPLFAFANAGVVLHGIGLADLLSPMTVGIAAGLVLGKQIGVFGMIWLTIVTGLSPRLRDTGWLSLYGVSLLCGVGFTMSLFIGGLAYPDPATQPHVKLGVMTGSLLSALAGYLVLRFSLKK